MNSREKNLFAPCTPFLLLLLLLLSFCALRRLHSLPPFVFSSSDYAPPEGTIDTYPHTSPTRLFQHFTRFALKIPSKRRLQQIKFNQIVLGPDWSAHTWPGHVTGIPTALWRPFDRWRYERSAFVIYHSATKRQV